MMLEYPLFLIFYPVIPIVFSGNNLLSEMAEEIVIFSKSRDFFYIPSVILLCATVKKVLVTRVYSLDLFTTFAVTVLYFPKLGLADLQTGRNRFRPTRSKKTFCLPYFS